jgi:hypothetical protein
MPSKYVETTTLYTSGQTVGANTNKILLIGRANQATSGYNTLVRIRDLNDAYTEYGNDNSNSAELYNMIDATLKQQVKPAFIYAIAVGKWTDSASVATTSAISAVGSDTITVTGDETTDFPAGTIFKVTATGVEPQFFKVKTATFGTTTAIVVEDTERVVYEIPVGATLTKIDTAAANHAGNAAYEAAFATALTAPLTNGGEIDIVTIDSWFEDDIIDLVAHATTASDENRERLSLFSAGSGVTTTALLTSIASTVGITSHRSILIGTRGLLDNDGFVVPPAIVNATLAAAISGEPDPAKPVHDIPLYGFIGTRSDFVHSELDTLVTGGVTPIWINQIGNITIERGVVTNTSVNYPKDIQTMRISDYTEKLFRRGLENKFSQQKNTNAVRDSMYGWIATTLKDLIDQEIIDGTTGRMPSQSVTAGTTTADRNTVYITINYYPIYGINKIYITYNLNLG